MSDTVEPSFGKIKGYTKWVRKDRIGRAGGGVAVCFKNGLQTQELSVDLPQQMEALFFRIVLTDNSGLLLCVLYRPPRQGRFSLDFLAEEMDNLLQRHGCKNVLIVGDLNFHLEQQAYNNLVTVSGLTNHVTFQTHERGGLLDPVLSDLPEERILCQQLDKVGSSDHHAVLTKIQLHVAREKAAPRTIWLWEQASWRDMRGALTATDWQTVLTGDAEEMTNALTSILATLQDRHVPHRTYLAKATNPQWFGFRCQIAAEAKYAAWRRYKQRPSQHNLTMHRAACKRMTDTSKWARKHWEQDLRRKLTGPGVGDKTWWTLVKERQGVMRQESVPLTRQDGTTASSSDDKAALLAKLFAEKMQVECPTRPPPVLPRETAHTITSIPITTELVEKHSGNWTQGKPRAQTESAPGAETMCQELHYRPISLLSVMGKVFEKLVAAVIWQHLDEHQLLSPHQFGFRPGRSTSDLLLLLSQEWQDTLDEGLDTLVVALDIAGGL
ncbi:uncharacterized protein LOC123519710 [Portunus trituberculatus]|uniref:uncharacterized protein LOC123519710 n=1 Tax=Portunus trituberculatus TaxID=210409 RepID=UPI001E1CF313|nr:uncharacterized protein LOC123519710 [Portunus trituberculatus]